MRSLEIPQVSIQQFPEPLLEQGPIAVVHGRKDHSSAQAKPGGGQSQADKGLPGAARPGEQDGGRDGKALGHEGVEPGEPAPEPPAPSFHPDRAQ